MKKVIILLVVFCLLFGTFFTMSTFASEEDEGEEWEYEFEEFDDEYFVLTPERQQAYIDGALNAVHTPSFSHYDNYMEIYYDNLTRNIGQNYQGSCGYVAIGMLLSYYDTFLNDGIIPEQYDAKGEGEGYDLISWEDSPGILRDEITKGDDLSSSGYYSVIDNQSEYSLHAKLITIGHGYGYYNYLSDMPAGTTFGMLLAVTKSYLKLYRGYTNNQYSIDYEYALFANEDNEVRSFVINNIQNGNPVLLALKSVNDDGEKEGHVVVAYDYDVATDEIFCYFGWGADKTHVTPESEGFTLYKAAFTIEFDLSQTHSYNYVADLGETNEKTYCSCYFSCHPEHECIYYKEYNEEYHTYACDCNLAEDSLLEHNWIYEDSNFGLHSIYCGDCGYSAEGQYHTYEYTCVDEIFDKGGCIYCGAQTYQQTHDFEEYNHCYERCSKCGYTIQSQAHDYTHRYESMSNTATHYAYCECGEATVEDHTFATSGALDICSFCKLEKDHIHEYTYISCHDQRTHRKMCLCGVSSIEACFGMSCPVLPHVVLCADKQ